MSILRTVNDIENLHVGDVVFIHSTVTSIDEEIITVCPLLSGMSICFTKGFVKQADIEVLNRTIESEKEES